MTLKAKMFDLYGTLANIDLDGHFKLFTLSEYTNTKNFKGTLVVIDHLGEDNQPFQIVNGTPTTHKLVSVDYIKELYECNR